MSESFEVTGQMVADAMREQQQFSRDLAALWRRGLSGRLLRDLSTAGQVATARQLAKVTYTPPPRHGLSRLWWRLRCALGASDPHDERRAQVAADIAALNEAYSKGWRP